MKNWGKIKQDVNSCYNSKSHIANEILRFCNCPLKTICINHILNNLEIPFKYDKNVWSKLISDPAQIFVKSSDPVKNWRFAGGPCFRTFIFT